MAYTRLPPTPLLLDELLELEELELEEVLEDELDELDDELDALEEELDDELDELLDEEDSVPGAPPHAAKSVMSANGIKCRIFTVRSSKVGGVVHP